LKRLLIARTEGNPFFLEECVRALSETHVLLGERGAYWMAGPVQTTAVPSTVQAVLAARIDRLPDEDRRLLQSAAVIGKDVPLALLGAIAGTPADELRRWLARLQSAEFLYETRPFPDLEFTFKHALTHEVAYKTLLHDRRRALHARIAEAMERLYADRLPEHVERLAHHAVSGERWERAVTYARQAGVKALARSAYRDAVAHFEHALAAVAHLPADRATSEAAIDLRFDLRTALTLLGEHGLVVEHLREAEALAKGLGDDGRLGLVSAYLADYFRQVGEHERAISAGERALAIARRLGDLTLEIASNTYLGHACQNTGQYRRAMALFRRNSDLASGELVRGTFGLPFVSSVQSRIWLASCLNELGELAEGIEVAEEAIRIAETTNHAASLATACSVLGNLYLRLGQPGDAVAVLERGYELSQAGHLHIWIPNAESWLGLAYAVLGRHEEGLRLLQSAVERERSMRRLAHHSVRMTALGEGLLLIGRADDAESVAGQALNLARKQGERGNEAHALRVLGEIAARSTPPALAEAEAAFRRGLALADELEMRPVAAHCHLGLARLWRGSGRLADAESHLDQALALFRAMGARALVEQAQSERGRSG
jgi:tetratricopeptide (TPR) repeat protein